MKDILEYINYREFLRDFYEVRKKSAEKFSLRSFARILGFHSAGFLQMVLEGERNLSSESIRKVVIGLKFNRDEAHYFTHLALLNQSKTVDERKHHAEQLLRSRGYKQLHPLKSAQFDFYTEWYCVVVRELVRSKDFREDPHWIAAAVEPAISVVEARAALDTLLELKLIERDTSGKLVQSQQALSTGDEVDSASVADFHKMMLHRAAESIDRFKPSERDISALTFGAGPETARQLKELIQRFRKELAAIITASAEEPSEVYELGFQLFPLSRTGRAKKVSGGGKR